MVFVAVPRCWHSVRQYNGIFHGSYGNSEVPRRGEERIGFMLLRLYGGNFEETFIRSALQVPG